MQIENNKLEWNAEAKIGSLDNAQHKPAGGDKKVSAVLILRKTFHKSDDVMLYSRLCPSHDIRTRDVPVMSVI